MMKTTDLMKIEKLPVVEQVSIAVKRKRVPTSKELSENEALVEQLWEMYQTSKSARNK
jgi:hypothetical protein